MPKTLNLIYSQKEFKFFPTIQNIKQECVYFKTNKMLPEFTDKDRSEIGRGESYAVFPELKKSFQEGTNVTLDSIKQGLNSRGITDEVLQNKVLFMLLQTRGGIQFVLGGMLMALFDATFLMSPEGYEVSIEVKNKDHAKLIFKTKLDDVQVDPRVTGIGVTIEIDINPGTVILDKFQFTKIGDNKNINEAFSNLEANQVNIFQKFILFLKNYFMGNPDLTIENETSDKMPWKKAYTTKPTPPPAPEIQQEASDDDKYSNEEEVTAPKR